MGSSGNEILDMYIYETNTLLEQLETIVLEAEKADTFSQDDVNEIFPHYAYHQRLFRHDGV